MEKKTCQQCKEDKSLDQFSKCSAKPDGLQIACKACNKINNKKFRDKRPKYQDEYRATPKGRAIKKRTAKRFFDNRGGGIYCMLNKLTNSIYIGQTSQFTRREIEWRMYPKDPKKYRKYMGSALRADVEKYGHENFEWRIIEVMKDSTVKQRRLREKNYIEAFSLITNVYNKQTKIHLWN